MSNRVENFTIDFDSKRGSIRLAAPLDVSRYMNTVQQVEVGNVTITQYEDGKFVAMEMTVPDAGLDLDVWGKRP